MRERTGRTEPPLGVFIIKIILHEVMHLTNLDTQLGTLQPSNGRVETAILF